MANGEDVNGAVRQVSDGDLQADTQRVEGTVATDVADPLASDDRVRRVFQYHDTLDADQEWQRLRGASYRPAVDASYVASARLFDGLVESQPRVCHHLGSSDLVHLRCKSFHKDRGRLAI